MAIDYSGLISEAGRAALGSMGNLPPEQRKAKMNDMLANGLLPFSVALAVDKQLNSPMKENAPSPRPGSVMADKMALLQKTESGIDQLPAPSMDQAQFAGGGIVAFDEGGTTADPFSGFKDMASTDRSYGMVQWLKSLWNNAPEASLQDEKDTVAAEQLAGRYGANSEAYKNYAGILSGRKKELDSATEEDRADARKAGWLAMAQAGTEGKGLLAGATAGLTKHAEVADAKKKERKAELRELQKEEYSLQLAMEQARAAGDKEAYARYNNALERNQKMQEIVGRGITSILDTQSRADTADKDRAALRDKDRINNYYFGKISALQERLRNTSIVSPEYDSLKYEIENLQTQWKQANSAVGYASIYGADARRDLGRESNQAKLLQHELDLVNATISDAQRAIAADPKDPKKQEILRRALKRRDEIMRQTGGTPEDDAAAQAGVYVNNGPAPAAPANPTVLDPSTR